MLSIISITGDHLWKQATNTKSKPLLVQDNGCLEFVRSGLKWYYTLRHGIPNSKFQKRVRTYPGGGGGTPLFELHRYVRP